MTKRWYFTYGSNMRPERMLARTGDAAGTPAVLDGWTLTFNKRGSVGGTYANIEPSEQHSTWGVAYHCDDAALRALDRAEGVGGGHYRRRVLSVTLDDGEQVDAVVYVACRKSISEGRPPEWYLHTILDGIYAWGLPDEATETVLLAV